MSDLEVFQISALQDNYIYVLRDHHAGLTAVVDPAESAPVLSLLQVKKWSLDFIWNTHHHTDHVGANLDLKRKFGCQILAFESDHHRIPGWDRLLADNETFLFGRHPIVVKHVPGHTLGHIAFYIPETGWLFCGDTLFSMGCGRLFEGTPAQMWTSLRWIKSLPKETLIFCTHEYTLANGQFAKFVEPDNQILQKRISEVRNMRMENRSTVPTTLEQELATNPFLRTSQEQIKKNIGVESADEIQVFAALRKLKDQF